MNITEAFDSELRAGMSVRHYGTGPILAGISRRLTMWQDKRRLQALPDYLLTDIGIARSQIDRALEFGRVDPRDMA